MKGTDGDGLSPLARSLMESTERVLATRHYSLRTAKAYPHWIARDLKGHQDLGQLSSPTDSARKPKGAPRAFQ